MATATSKTSTVLGTVTDANKRPLSNLKVEIYDADMRSWQPLADTVTDKNGKYELHWQHSQLSGRGKKSADIAIKVLTAVKGTELYQSAMNQVRFNAGEREEINVVIKEPVPVETIEFDYLTEQVRFLANEIAITDLQQNRQFQDITFLANELEEPAEKLEHLVVAWRLNKIARLDADFAYALLRQHTLARAQTAGLLSTTRIGIHSDDKLVLYQAALTDPKQVEADVKTAAAEKQVASTAIGQMRKNLELLSQYRQEAEAYFQKEHGRKAIDLLATVFRKESLNTLQQLFEENKNDLNRFFDKVLDASFLTPPKEKSATHLALHKLFGFTGEWITQTAKAKGVRKPTDVGKLARLNTSDWTKEIAKAHPSIKDKKLIRAYASSIARKMEREFPTQAFTAQLEREKNAVLANQDKLVAFLNKHDGFDLTSQNVDLYLKEKKVSRKESLAVGQELKSVQRIFRLIPRYAPTLALRREQIHSAQRIAGYSQTRFVEDIGAKAGLTPQEATAVYRKAVTRHTAALLLAGNLHDGMSVSDIASFDTQALALKIQAVTKDFPNLKSLFQGIDTCACQHCRSVYSPAAYLVELLQFLDKRSVAAGNAKTVLFTRRPDLGEIDLSCANANTPVKYIDLVCELLEEAVAPDPGIAYTGNLSDGPDPLTGRIATNLLTTLQAAGLPVTANALVHPSESDSLPSDTLPHYLRDTQLVCKIENTGGSNYRVYRLRQTLSTAEELDAAPEYVNTSAYDELRTKTYAFTLPFDLNHTEASAYLKRFDIVRADLMEAFQAGGNPADQAIAAERLGLTDAERRLLISPPAPNTNAAQQAFWNVPAPGNVIDYLKQVDHFLDRTGLTYKQLDLLVKLDFIDANGNLFIEHKDLTCDTAQKEIANLDLAALDRIHRFLRLQKKTGWTYEVWNAILSQPNLGNTQLNDATLIKAAQLKEICRKTGIKPEELIGCFGYIPHTVFQEEAPKPLYHQVFLNKARNGMSDERLLPEKVDGSQTLAPLAGVLATILQMKQKDLERLLPLLPDGSLTFANLSYLYALSRLVRKLKVKADQLSWLISLSGISITDSPEKLLQLVDLYTVFRLSPLKAADVAFVLDHDAANLTERVISDDRVAALLTQLKTQYLAINTLFESKYDDNLSATEQSGTLATVLAGLAGVTEEDTKTVLGFLDRKWTLVSAAKAFLDSLVDPDMNLTAIHAAMDALNAVSAGGDTSAEQKALVKALLDAIAAYQIRTAKRVALEQLLATGFKSTPEMMQAILNQALLRQPAPGTDRLADLLSDDLTNSISPVNFPQQFAALRLLDKMLYLIHAFALKPADVAWYLANNQALGWLQLDGIPYETGQTAIPFARYLDFVQLRTYAKELSPVINPADAEHPVSFFSVAQMLSPTTTATKDELMQALALLTGYEKADLAGIDARLFAVFDKANYRKASVWVQLLACAELLRKTSSTVAQVVEYIKPVLLAADVQTLRATLKSRYDEDTWLSTLKQIIDAIRPQKRDALIAYLLATNPDIKDTNDLYEYFLVDVEMEACMPSSRIVQAHNSIQLFVQRCLMGLEPEAIAQVSTDPNWNQWQWMKNYRVWEANRKVFLYPENWYEVTLSDEKSYLLDELIEELQQNEPTNDSAELALRAYLEKLDQIAFLEVMATWYDVPTRTMHVFARTKGGDPAPYFYRRFEGERYWTPWEKVDLDISGDHLLAFMRNNRLYLAWPVFGEESDPNQGSKLPNQSNPNEQPIDKPRKKLRIQLAISEHLNNKWQPKKVSKQGILTPSYYTPYESQLNRSDYNMLYFPQGSQIWFFKDAKEESITISGIFSVTGCKGYPELLFQGNASFPDFYPDFKDTLLASQRYNELAGVLPDELAVRNAISLFTFYELLGQTPGTFRISYPHQFTQMDLLFLIHQLLIQALFANLKSDRRFRFKIPMGTLLPYFEEDSNHAYVIIPGFYKREIRDGRQFTFTDAEKRTASDVFQLLDEVVNWIRKMIARFQDNPPADTEAAIQAIITDADFQDLLEEMSHYQALDFIFDFLMGKTGNEDFDAWLKELKASKGLVYGEQFKNMYHPLLCSLRSVLYKDGIPGLMKRETQLQKTPFNFQTHYRPNPLVVPRMYIKNPDGTQTATYPIEDVDFTGEGSYSVYNWDLFFRVPLHIATRLTQNQRFEEALTWFHYMFNPTGALPGTGVQKYWVTKPFYLNQTTDYISQRIDMLLFRVADPANPAVRELEFAISEWRDKPFRPDAVARFRPVAYQKALLMKYIDNLTEWGDYLFRQDTMESVAQATQMYILADKLLGPKPRTVPAVVKPPYLTYNQLEAGLDSFGNALVELENLLPDLSALPEGGAELPPPPLTLSTLYFCVPGNEQMNAYWDRVADRLFKIRHCQNIDGIERSLALFAPPIDPGMLVKAAASGLDLSAVMAGLNAPTPLYRFAVLSQKATELATDVRVLGNSLLQALEKRDSEAMSLLRSELEIKLLNAVRDLKKLQVDEADAQIQVLNRSRLVTEERHAFYASIEKINTQEQLNLDKLEEAKNWQLAANITYTLGAALALIPDVSLGVSGFGGSPHGAARFGGSLLAHSTDAIGKGLGVFSALASYEANKASINGTYNRRFDDWKLQERLSRKELNSIDQQIAAANIRKQVAQTELTNHDIQIDNAKRSDEFMRTKFTNQELYTWMIGQISGVYFKAYQLAHDFAKKAERCYRFELGTDDSFISYGYWDSLKKGLQSADNLIHDIKRMEGSFTDKNKREYEITKHISLAQLDPLALIQLRTTGVCDFEVPEVLYDMDHPGHYFRRLKSVSVSLPCVAGPYTSVSARLSLVKNKYRKNTDQDNAAATGYAEDPDNDERFTYNVGSIQSIATSNAQNDSGLFELNFRDERYLPFEGKGAVSSWRLELPTEVRQFDYQTIADLVLHVRYTSREGGSSLRNAANTTLKDQLSVIGQGLAQQGLHLALSLKYDLPNEWHLLKANGTVNLKIDRFRLPYLAQPFGTQLENVIFLADVQGNPASFTLQVNADTLNLSRIDDLKITKGTYTNLDLDTEFSLSVANADLIKLNVLMMVVKYSF